MASFLLFSKKTDLTGKKLAKVLGISSGNKLDSKTRKDWLIRWGSTTPVALRPVNGTINPLKAVNTVVDKFFALEFFRLAGIPAPRTVIATRETVKTWTLFPALLRSHQHQQGKDIILCMQENDVVGALRNITDQMHLVEYIPTKTEYRIHVFGEEILKVSEKVLRDKTKFSPWIRNLEHGYVFNNPHIEPSVYTKNVAISAVTLAGLHFGAVDVIVSDRGVPYVLEVNTGPGLIVSSLRLYATKLSEIIGEPVNEDVLQEIATAEEAEQTEEE